MPFKESDSTLTERDISYLVAAMKSTKGEFVIDFDKFAELTGRSTNNAARKLWGRTKQKLDKAAGLGGDAGEGTEDPGYDSAVAKKGTDGGKKRKAAAAELEDTENITVFQSAAKPHKRGRPAKSAKKDTDAERSAKEQEDSAEIKVESENA